jgi:hypothetical protein
VDVSASGDVSQAALGWLADRLGLVEDLGQLRQRPGPYAPLILLS